MIRSKKLIRVFSAAFAIVLLLFSVTACSSNEEPAEETVFDVEVTTPDYNNIEVSGDFIGRVASDAQVMIIPKIAGDVTGVYFNVGDHVNAGDLLFTVDDSAIRIQLSQAQASLDSVRASVNSAQSNVALNEANLNYTQAQVNQNIGTASTNRMQLENAVNQAKYAVDAAEGNVDIARAQLGLATNTLDDLDENIDALLDGSATATNYAKGLTAVRTMARSIREASGDNASTAQGVIDKLYKNKQISENAYNAVKTKTTVDGKINELIKQMTKLDDEVELSLAISTTTNQSTSLKTQAGSLEGNRDSLRVNQLSAAIGLEVARNNAYKAVDARKLAQKMLSDYDNYTMAVILAGAQYQQAAANTQMASAQSGLAQAQAGVRQAQAGVDAARLQLGYTQVKSPVSGTVTAKNVTVNNMATQSQPSFIIASDNDKMVEFSVAETVMRVIEVGDNVQVERNGSLYTATVTENAGFPDLQTGLFLIKARLNEDADLIDGTTVKLTLITRKAENALTVPVDCVYYENHTAYVFVEKNGVAVKTIVETGLTDNEFIEITDGLSPDAKVITTWHSQMSDGSKVSIIK